MRISDWSSDVCSSDLTAERTSGFLMRLLFTMFAEDSGLIPEKSFINLLKNQRAAPQHLEHKLAALWAAMDAGASSPEIGVTLRKRPEQRSAGKGCVSAGLVWGVRCT